METTRVSFNSKQVELATYNDFLGSLIAGSRSRCQNIVEKCMSPQLPIRVLYEQFLCRSLYEVGELWEFNKISVATEHVATAITEGLDELSLASNHFADEN
jgi:methanogenic corrinoid protein MtbC1